MEFKEISVWCEESVKNRKDGWWLFEWVAEACDGGWFGWVLGVVDNFVSLKVWPLIRRCLVEGLFNRWRIYYILVFPR